MNPLLFFAIALKASLLSTSGFGNVPSLHHDLLAGHWATETDFGEAMAVGQISPGPNGLWVVSLGYLMDGWRGSLLALVAITIPPILVLLLENLYRQVKHHPVVEGFIRGLSLAVVGVFVVVLFGLLNRVGIDLKSVGISLGAMVLWASRRVPVVGILILGGGAGILF
ncbi:MAG: chromate transporter [Chthonomonadales bacterium]